MNAARAASLAAIALALAACGSKSTTSPPTTTQGSAPVVLAVTVGPKGVAGGPRHLTVKQGSKAVLVVRSALADEVHFHGYDLARDVEAGGTARIPFTASVPGRFEVELEKRKLPIAEIEVTP